MSESVRKLHVLFFVPILGGGGAEKHLVRVANHLDPERFRVSLAVARSGGSYHSELQQHVEVHDFGGERKRSSMGAVLRAIKPLRQLIDRDRPDVLCPVMDASNLAAVASVRSLPSPPKIVLSVQAPPAVRGAGLRGMKKRLWAQVTRSLYRRNHRIIALSTGVAESIAAVAPAAADRVEVIYNAGVDAAVLEGASQPLPPMDRPPGKPLIVACGRLTEQKGFRYLLDAFARVRSEMDVGLWIIGDGPDRDHLEHRIRELDLRGEVQLLGFKDNPYQYMAAADVFVLSSLWEGFGNVVVEAMACGAPVVSTDCPYGPGEIIQDRESGLLVPPANAAALAEAVLQVLRDEQLRRSLASQATVRARDFHASVIAGSYGDLFLRVAAREAVEPQKPSEI